MTEKTEEALNDPWGPSPSWLPEFSNCFEPASAITIGGKVYKSTEHYYQSRKFTDATSVEIVLSQPSPIKAKLAARRLSDKARKRETFKPGTFREGRPIHMLSKERWEETKEAVMFEATFAKYRQHSELRRLLLSTDGREIVEPNVHDEYWGCGRDGAGRNRLGFVLMRVRSVLLKENQEKMKSLESTVQPEETTEKQEEFNSD